MKYMLDTNICMYAILGGDAHLDGRLDDCQTGDLVLSAVTLGELEAGGRAVVAISRAGGVPVRWQGGNR